MKKNITVNGIIIDETTSFTFTEVCEKYQIQEKVLIEFIEYGLFETHQQSLKDLHINAKNLRRILAALRLQDDLGINTPGVVLALELIDKLDLRQHELDVLKKYFKDDTH